MPDNSITVKFFSSLLLRRNMSISSRIVDAMFVVGVGIRTGFCLLKGLPDEKGRIQILEIHTKNLTESEKLAKDVDLNYLAAETKNFSGAEIEGLVRAATTLAMNQLIKVNSIQVLNDVLIGEIVMRRYDVIPPKLHG